MCGRVHIKSERYLYMHFNLSEIWYMLFRIFFLNNIISNNFLYNESHLINLLKIVQLLEENPILAIF